jgi:heme/copper-type cytochrome/quinol oxidase subunit 1
LIEDGAMPRVTRLLLLVASAALLLGPVACAAWTWSRPEFSGVSRLCAGILMASSLIGFCAFVTAFSQPGLRERWFAFPLIWLAAAVMFCGGTACPVMPRAADMPDPGYAAQDTYYVVAHGHYALSLFGAFAVFAAVYAALWGWLRLPRASRLGWTHLVLFTVGVAVIFSPQIVLGWQGMPKRYADYQPAFTFWNRISSVGYMIALASLFPFLAVLALAAKDLWTRRSAARGV